MKLISWNVKGCNALDKCGLEQMKPYLVCFQETKMSLEEAEGWMKA